MNSSPSSPPPAPIGLDGPLAAVTGASGFIGRHLVAALAHAGWRTRLLLRREPDEPAWHDFAPEVVAGALADPAALAKLVHGADAVIHLAGLIKAARRAHYFAVNRDGAVAIARATAAHAPAHARFVLVSSLAAREPQLSDYGASKHAAEDAVLGLLGARATVLRPPVVYGPGDRETLMFFKLARGRVVPLLGMADARAAMIHVDDLARLVVALAGDAGMTGSGHAGAIVTAADARPEGYGWEEFLHVAARAVGNDAPRFVRVPQSLLGAAARMGDVARACGLATMLSSDKLRELRHPDWSVAPHELARTADWQPRFDLQSGFADAVAWYRRMKWLP